jgi:hypothetical protein
LSIQSAVDQAFFNNHRGLGCIFTAGGGYKYGTVSKFSESSVMRQMFCPKGVLFAHGQGFVFDNMRSGGGRQAITKPYYCEIMISIFAFKKLN